MVWKCPPLNLFNWSNLWKWKEDMKLYKYTIRYEKTFVTIEPRVFEPREVEMIKQNIEMYSHINNTTGSKSTLEIISSELDTVEWKQP